MAKTKSNRAAARYLNVSYQHYRKYAKLYKNEDGITLLEAHKNQAGKGIPKFLNGGKKSPAILDINQNHIILRPRPRNIRNVTLLYTHMDHNHIMGLHNVRLYNLYQPFFLSLYAGSGPRFFSWYIVT